MSCLIVWILIQLDFLRKTDSIIFSRESRHHIGYWQSTLEVENVNLLEEIKLLSLMKHINIIQKTIIWWPPIKSAIEQLIRISLTYLPINLFFTTGIKFLRKIAQRVASQLLYYGQDQSTRMIEKYLRKMKVEISQSRISPFLNR